MKKIILACLFLLVGCSNEKEMLKNEMELSYELDNPVVSLSIKDYGDIVVELYPDIAPNTVNNFIELVGTGFYDDNTIHRLDKEFVLQGGDPTGTGTGGPGYSIPGEFDVNGFTNTLSHTTGVISMARSIDYDSGGSQFFIMLGDATSLDGAYASFGIVIEGMDVIEKLKTDAVVADAYMGVLEENFIIEKATVDLNNYELQEVEKIFD